MFPVLPVSTSLSVPTYYLIISITVSICLVWVNRRAQQLQLSQKLTLDLGLIIMVAGFLGGRLLHVAFEDFAYYREQPFRILQFWQGGFVFYGGALLAGLSGYFFLRIKAKEDLKNYLDLLAPPLALAYALGRLGCLLAGCCYGKYCELPWSIAGRHPTQAYASLWEVGVLFILLGIEKAPLNSKKIEKLKQPGNLFFLWMLLHAFGRLLMEAYRDDFRGPTLGLSISSWISIAVAVSAAWLLKKNSR